MKHTLMDNGEVGTDQPVKTPCAPGSTSGKMWFKSTSQRLAQNRQKTSIIANERENERENEMAALKRIALKCPYCGNEFSQWFDLGDCIKPDYTELVYCDQEETQGCGKVFVVKPEISLDVQVFTMQKVTA